MFVYRRVVFFFALYCSGTAWGQSNHCEQWWCAAFVGFTWRQRVRALLCPKWLKERCPCQILSMAFDRLFCFRGLVRSLARYQGILCLLEKNDLITTHAHSFFFDESFVNNKHCHFRWPRSSRRNLVCFRRLWFRRRHLNVRKHHIMIIAHQQSYKPTSHAVISSIRFESQKIPSSLYPYLSLSCSQPSRVSTFKLRFVPRTGV